MLDMSFLFSKELCIKTSLPLFVCCPVLVSVTRVCVIVALFSCFASRLPFISNALSLLTTTLVPPRYCTTTNLKSFHNYHGK